MINELELLYSVSELSAVDADMVAVVHEASKNGFGIDSDFARENVAAVSMAASMAMITTNVTKDVYSREWRPTPTGVAFLNEMEIEEG